MQLDLSEYENVFANNLSGGNKRKLSVAISMMTCPKLLLLDEPSTGIDPISRRHLWDIISEVSLNRDKANVIITTHSMEEAEALCGIVGIMVRGKMMCYGGIQELKNKYGASYILSLIMLQPSEEEVQEFNGKFGKKLIDLECAKAMLTELHKENWVQLLDKGKSGEYLYEIFQSEKEISSK